MQIPELLAPAGNMDAFKAAVANGADAVYLGGQNFSARALAANFSGEEFAQAVAYAHLHGVKVYAAVNTLMKNEELPAALGYLKQLYLLNVDAVIVQDLGLLHLARLALPRLPLHASTQMTAHNSGTVNFLADCGAERVILARELSFADIEAIKNNCRVELEVFVHGALCICYSGQCLMSSMIGARSGNRGRCAQPCRLPYLLLDEKGQAVLTEAGPYLLSPRDLYGYEHLPRLLRLEPASLKIEGRMKRAEYVAVVVSAYRRLLDAIASEAPLPDQERELQDLLQVFNRDRTAAYWLAEPGAELMSHKRPNNRGVYLGRVEEARPGFITVKLELPLRSGDGLEIWVKKGGRVGFTAERMLIGGQPVEQAAAGESVSLPTEGYVRVGDRVFRTYDRLLMEKAQASYAEDLAIEVDFTLEARLGQPLHGQARDKDGNMAVYTDDYIVKAARTSPADYEKTKEQLGRLGGSGFSLRSLQTELDENVMLPASVLNNLRRNLTEELRRMRLAPYQKPPLEEKAFAAVRASLYKKSVKTPVKSLSISVMAQDFSGALAAAKGGAQTVYLAAECFDRREAPADVAKLKSLADGLGARLVPALPRIFHDDEAEFWREKIKTWRLAGCEAILIANLGALQLLRGCAWTGAVYGDTSLNVFNNAAAEVLARAGLSRVLLSPELSLAELSAFASADIEKEVLAHGAAPLMVSEHCLLGALKGGQGRGSVCSAPCRENGRYFLRDEKGFEFPCRFDASCRAHIFNSRELCLIADLPRFAEAGINSVRLDLRLHAPEQIREITAIYVRTLRGADAAKAENALAAMSASGFTKGHYYRGV
ncbi:MAG: U32 family peptidase [Clostridiales bacterium]|nr:U32 family peptidase [Clostridiales bacterium]